MTQSAQTATGPRVGETAPDFTTGSTAGSKMTLSSWRGKKNVLLAFFPLAFTSTCSQEMGCFHADVDRFESADTKVFGVSVDSVPSLRVFQEKLGIDTEMLSDFKREIGRLYGVLDEERSIDGRAYFLIDKAGVLRWRHVEEDLGKKRENSEILEQISRLD